MLRPQPIEITRKAAARTQIAQQAGIRCLTHPDRASVSHYRDDDIDILQPLDEELRSVGEAAQSDCLANCESEVVGIEVIP